MKFAVSSLILLCFAAASTAAEAPKRAGASGKIGTLSNPKLVDRLEIKRPGVYENILVDAKGGGGNIVKITASGVTLRNCEIRNGTGNGVGVFGTDVTVENCHIHHLLASTFAEQHDAHGVTGRWGNVVIRNCDIHHTSGDSVQFDPDRQSSGSVTIENCTFWSGPLAEDSAGFKRGETPGENAFDSKTKPDAERCKLIVRDCYFHGWQQPGQIDNMAALNLKENIDATVTNCVFRHNENALRIRGPGKRGGAWVTVTDCAIYDGTVGVRIEDKAENLKITGLAFGSDVKTKYKDAGGGAGAGFDNKGERKAGPIEERIVSANAPKP
jgi:hypothetical protein